MRPYAALSPLELADMERDYRAKRDDAADQVARMLYANRLREIQHEWICRGAEVADEVD